MSEHFANRSVAGSSRMNEALRRTYLDAMGIQVWEQRDGTLDVEGQVNHKHASNHAETQRKTGSEVPRLDKVPQRDEVPQRDKAPQRDKVLERDKVLQLDWDALQQQVASCVGCGLHTGRTQTVFGTGNRQAELLIIGEAPGEDEDLQGEPFVGKAGKLLNEMLFAIGLERRAVYIANILKCRPPSNRDPQPSEVSACEPYLRRQVQLIKPRLILAVGRIAAQNLLMTDTSIGKLRGKQYVYSDMDIPVMVTYHPAYLLRSPMEKRKSWQDLLMVKDVLGSGNR